jgi:hypothetical protein
MYRQGKPFPDLENRDVIRELARTGAEAETKRKRLCAALQVHRGVDYFRCRGYWTVTMPFIPIE